MRCNTWRCHPCCPLRRFPLTNPHYLHFLTLFFDTENTPVRCAVAAAAGLSARSARCFWRLGLHPHSHSLNHQQQQPAMSAVCSMQLAAAPCCQRHPAGSRRQQQCTVASAAEASWGPSSRHTSLRALLGLRQCGRPARGRPTHGQYHCADGALFFPLPSSASAVWCRSLSLPDHNNSPTFRRSLVLSPSAN
jgi:hypothetical protein